LHGEQLPYAKDALVFMHKQAQYWPGLSPLLLSWRDKHICKYVVDTPDVNGVEIPPTQAVVLELRTKHFLRTEDKVIVGQAQEEQLKKIGKVRVKELLRGECDGVDQAGKLINLRLTGKAGRNRPTADSMGRIVFQHLHRHGLAAVISIEALVAAAMSPTSLAQLQGAVPMAT